MIARLATLTVLALTTNAFADVAGRLEPGQGERVFLPPSEDPGLGEGVSHAGTVSKIIYLERCKGGCLITKGGLDDALTLHSTIPKGNATEFTLAEFENSAGQTGAAADAEWAEVVKCVREVYSPFAAVITDVKPVGTSYHVNVVAGVAPDLGLSSSILGISPGVSCAPVDNRITYTFANAQGGTGRNRVNHLCWTIAQETAHTYSLDHSYAFSDQSSACNDPMTYRSDCGGQKFFRNDGATCGEYQPRPCDCGASQNAHLTLLATFGPGTPLTAPPTLSVTQPAPNAQIAASTAVIATAYSQRGVKTLELWLNGYKWGTAKGAGFGADGQPESSYSIPIPAAVPDGVIDIVVKAKDDIDATTTSPTLTVTKGAPCVTEASCAAGQQCANGRCFWDAPVGVLGDECTYAQYCLSGVCQGTADKQICTEQCIVGVADSCSDPAAYECLETSPGKGVCWPKGEDTGNCLGCATSGPGGAAAAPFAFFAFGLAFVLRRRRR
ncbi:MAG: hypothetical protein IPQ07_19215 [Myxococcales bacterium]|nr:hypothetical protein [Myxococcales bacterium]